MATNLVICYPHIGFIPGTLLGTTSTAASGYPRENAILGPRYKTFKCASSVLAIQVDVDLGSGNTVNPQYAACGRLDLMTKRDSGSPIFQLIGANNSSFTSPESLGFAVATSQLVGPRKEDYIFETTFSQAYRYWRMVVTANTSYTWEISKFFAGTWFDFGRDVAYPETIQRVPVYGDNKDAAYQFDFTWEGITDATLNSFNATIVKYKDVAPIYLYTRSYHYTLNNDRLVYAYVRDAKSKKVRYNTNTVTVTFEEIL